MNFQKKTIYIPIEIFYREINSRVLLSLTAVNYGYRVYLGTKAGIDELLNQKLNNRKKSGVYLYKSQIVSNPRYINKVNKTCEKFLVIDEELGPGMINIDENLIRRTANDKNISLFFVIGKKIQKKLKRIKKNFDKKVCITGWPKYDLYRNKFRNLYEYESKKIKKKYGNFTLVISNFGAVSKEGLKIHTANLKKKIYLKNKKVYLRKDIETLTQYYKDFLNFVKKFKLFLKENKTKKFIIRPHPSDYFHSVWEKEFKNYSNVKVIYDNDIVPWIKASSSIIHRGCSTAIDAFFLKKKIYFYLPDRKLKLREKNLTYILSKKIKNFNEIQSSKKNIYFYPSLKKKLEQEIFSPQKFTSSSLIIKAINSLKINKIKKHEDIKFMRNFKDYANFVLRKIKIKKDLHSVKLLNKFPEIITKSYLIKKAALLFPKRKFKIRKLGYNLFEIDN